MGRDMVGPALLQQMRGRAGRKGKDEVGETFVCCASEDFPLVEQLLETGLPAIQSSLLPEKRGLHRALLEVVAVRLAHHRSAIQDYLECTLLSRTMDPSALYTLADRTLLELVSDGFLKVDDHVYNATKLGQAAVVASLTPEEGLVVYADLEKAMEKFILKSHMHALYLLTPVNVPGLETINWGHFRREVDNLDESGLAVLEICGLNPGLVNRMYEPDLLTCLFHLHLTFGFKASYLFTLFSIYFLRFHPSSFILHSSSLHRFHQFLLF